MNSSVISLRDYIKNRKEIDSVKIQTFCRLMKRVSEAIDKQSDYLIKINLDDIKININTGEILFPNEVLNENQLDKTIAGFNTGISLMADRKSSKEHKKVAFALMLLGWYCNEDGSAIINDIDVLENFDSYMSMVPSWLRSFFVSIFKNMNYEISFSDYYRNNFENVINKKIEDSFAEYNLTKEQMTKVKGLVAKETNRLVKEGVTSAT